VKSGWFCDNFHIFLKTALENDFQDKILEEERLEKARKSYEIGRWIDQLANRRFESTPKSQILPPNHKNTKFHQR
jgi:hypothetical protein